MNFTLRNRFVDISSTFFEIFGPIFDFWAYCALNTHSDLGARGRSEMYLSSSTRTVMTARVRQLDVLTSTSVWHSLGTISHFSESNEYFIARFSENHYIRTEDRYITEKAKSGSEIEKSISNRSESARNGFYTKS